MSLQEDCPRALGMEDGRINDSSIRASSTINTRYQPANGRLNLKATNYRFGGWIAKGDDRNPWFEVRFGSTAIVSRVATQGVYPYVTWVKTFVLEYSKDGNTFFFYNIQQTFEGNRDRNSTKNNELKPAIDVRVIRIHPKSWQNRYPGMRVEFYGCRPVSNGNVTGQAISAESIEVKWQFAGNKEDNSLPCGVTVWYRSVHTSATNKYTWIKSQTVDTETTHYTIHSLLANTTYEIYVEALNDECSGWLDHVARVITHEKDAEPHQATPQGNDPIRTSSPKTEEMLPTVEGTPSTKVNRKKSEDHRGTNFVITGVVLAVAVGLVLVLAIIAVYMFKKRRKNKRKRKPKEEQGVIIYENDTTFSHGPNLLDSVDARITHQEQRELQTDHSYYNSKVNVKVYNFDENNGPCASDIYSYANSNDVRCNQSNDEKLSAEQRSIYENNENLGSSNETTDYEEVQGNPDNSSISKQMQQNAPANKTLAEKEVMSKLCSTQTLQDSRVNTSQPKMKPEYTNLKGPDPIPMQHSDNVYQHLNKSDTGSGAYECLQKHESFDFDVSWSSPNQSRANIRNIEEAYEPLATSKMPSTSTNSYYEKLCLSKADEDVYDSKYENVGDSFT